VARTIAQTSGNQKAKKPFHRNIRRLGYEPKGGLVPKKGGGGSDFLQGGARSSKTQSKEGGEKWGGFFKRGFSNCWAGRFENEALGKKWGGKEAPT